MTQKKAAKIFEYQGLLSFEKIEDILNQFKEAIIPYNIDVVIRKRIFSILVECLENTFRHNIAVDEKVKRNSVEFLLSISGNDIVIRIGNYIKNSNISTLTQRIDTVNKLDQNDLNKLYRESIAKTRISDKGGAGLGIIEIARNSRQVIEYEFDKSEGDFSFLNLVVKVKKQQ